MLVGRCVWGKTDADPDTMEIFRVYDAPGFGPMVLKEPVCVLKEVIPQAGINKLSIKDFEKGGIDEIRIDAQRHDRHQASCSKIREIAPLIPGVSH